jgi:hypothetical protein
MARRKRRAEGEAPAEGTTPVPSDVDVKFAEGLKEFDKLVALRLRISRKIETFKRRAKITPATIRRFIAELVEALD